MGVIYKGREVASNQCKVRTELIDGKAVEILYNIPKSWKKVKFKDEQPAAKKTTYRMSAEREHILYRLLQRFELYAQPAILYKTKAGKYACQCKGGKWFTLGLTQNKSEPKGRILWVDPEGKILKDRIISTLTTHLKFFGQPYKIPGGWCVCYNGKWFTLTLTENRTQPEGVEFTAHRKEE